MIYVSTNIYAKADFSPVFDVVAPFDGQVGIELFANPHFEDFQTVMDKNRDRLKDYPLTLHGPYVQTEHSAPKGSKEYSQAMAHIINTFTFLGDLEPKFMVYHTNNCKIYDIAQQRTHAMENMAEIAEMTSIPLVIENVGVHLIGNVLYDQDDFIRLIQDQDAKALIDIGHAYANDWSFDYLIPALADHIVAYHLHSNDGLHDSHERIFENGPDMDHVLKLIHTHTPEADLVLEYHAGFADKPDVLQEDLRKLLDWKA